MALLARKVAANAPGAFFVDDACIACDTCRRLASATFGGGEDDVAFVARQPASSEEERREDRHDRDHGDHGHGGGHGHGRGHD